MISKLPELRAEYSRVLNYRNSNRLLASVNFGLLAAAATPLFTPGFTSAYAIWAVLGSVHAGFAYSQSRRLRKIGQLNELVEKDVENPEIDRMIAELFGSSKDKYQRAREQRLQARPRADLPVSGRAIGSDISQASVSIPAPLDAESNPEPPEPNPEPPAPSPATPGPRKFKR